MIDVIDVVDLFIVFVVCWFFRAMMTVRCKRHHKSEKKTNKGKINRGVRPMFFTKSFIICILNLTSWIYRS
jgi:hypothetical protein